MKYYANYENGKLVAIGTGYGGTEITESEYNELLTTIREKAALVNRLYNEEITVGEVPMEWQEEIQRRVNDRIAAEGEAAEQDISGEEFVDMLEGVL
jgi:hypothetical protein